MTPPTAGGDTHIQQTSTFGAVSKMIKKPCIQQANSPQIQGFLVKEGLNDEPNALYQCRLSTKHILFFVNVSTIIVRCASNEQEAKDCNNCHADHDLIRKVKRSCVF